MDANWIKRDETPKSIFNPMKIDLVCSIRDDNNVPQDYIVHSMEIETYPAYIANIIIKKLITAIKYARNVPPHSQEEEDKIKKEVEVVIE